MAPQSPSQWIRILWYGLFARPVMRWILGIRIEGRENLDLSGQVLIVSNHNSHIDTVVLMDLVGLRRMARFRPVAAADYFESSALIRTITRLLFNILSVRRKGAEGTDPLDTMAAALEAGDNLIMFPEGTRGEPEKPGRFRSGAGHLLARFPNLRVIPVYLHGMGRIMPKGQWYPWPYPGRVIVGAPTIFTGTAKEITKALESAVHELGRGCRDEGQGVEPRQQA